MDTHFILGIYLREICSEIKHQSNVNNTFWRAIPCQELSGIYSTRMKKDEIYGDKIESNLT